MPRRRKFKKKYALTRWARRNSITAQKFKYPKVYASTRRFTPAIVPDHSFVKLKYATTVTVIANNTDQQMRGNSAFDPDASGVGSQPAGYDQWSAFYNRYRVHASSIKVLATNFVTTIPAEITLYPDNSATAAASADTAAIRPYSKSRLLGIATGNANTVIKSFMKSKKMFGVKSIQMSDDYSALTTANPTQDWFWHIVVSGADGGTAPFPLYLRIIIEYFIEFYDRVPLTYS